jgi:hypothetical protein
LIIRLLYNIDNLGPANRNVCGGKGYRRKSAGESLQKIYVCFTKIILLKKAERLKQPNEKDSIHLFITDQYHDTAGTGDPKRFTGLPSTGLFPATLLSAGRKCIPVSRRHTGRAILAEQFHLPDPCNIK